MKNKTDIIWLDNVDSTNSEARRRFSELDNLSVLSALSQTDGRGQRGNSWSSEDGKNLLCSIVLKAGSEIMANEQFVVSQIAALSVTDLLASHGIKAAIKWPNDIYVNDEKICGILIENTVCGKYLSSSIIGIGLNINQRNFDVNIPNPTSMAICKPQSQGNEENIFCIRTILEELMEIFVSYKERFLNITGGYSRLDKLYQSQLWKRDVVSDFIDNTVSPPAAMQGTIRGVSPIGTLIIETKEGELREFAFKEISYQIRAPKIMEPMRTIVEP